MYGYMYWDFAREPFSGCLWKLFCTTLASLCWSIGEYGYHTSNKLTHVCILLHITFNKTRQTIRGKCQLPSLCCRADRSNRPLISWHFFSLFRNCFSVLSNIYKTQNHVRLFSIKSLFFSKMTFLLMVLSWAIPSSAYYFLANSIILVWSLEHSFPS